MLARRIVSLYCAALLASCGSNPFSERNEGIDFPGTLRFAKLDQRPDVSNALGIQAVSLAAALGDELHDPTVLESADGSLEMFYASHAARGIARSRAPAGTLDWEGGNIVLRAGEPWEEGVVSAPAAIVREGRHELWYTGGAGAGIGRAVSDDGVRWTKEPRAAVLVPSEAWEAGAVRAPAVTADAEGRLWMAYEAGDGAAIGMATSDDGVEWARVARRDTSSGPTVTRGPSGSWSEARVAAPALRIERTAAGRPVFRLWYEGMARNDFSIGEAGSYDAVEWVESSLNPVLAEQPPLGFTIGADERQPWVIGEAGQRRLFFVTRQLEPLAEGIGVATDAPPAAP